VVLGGSLVWAIPPEYEVLIEKNPFSPSRQYIPPTKQGNQSSGTKEISEDKLKKEVILRGTFWNGKQYLAILEVKASFKQRYKLSKERFILSKGERLGPCELLEIDRGAVVLGGACGSVRLSLADAPERKQPLPKGAIMKPPSVPLPPSQAKPPQQPKTKPPSPPQKKVNPFRKFLQPQKPAPPPSQD